MPLTWLLATSVVSLGSNQQSGRLHVAALTPPSGRTPSPKQRLHGVQDIYTLATTAADDHVCKALLCHTILAKTV